MYYNVQMYFANGGGPCYIVPVGIYNYSDSPSEAPDFFINKTSLINGLKAIAVADEPTLLVIPDAVSLVLADSNAVYTEALTQCQTLKDRFTIMDVKTVTSPSTDAGNFRTSGIGIDNLRYGAAYYPYLNTSLNYHINEDLVHVTSQSTDTNPYSDSVDVISFLHDVEMAILETRRGLNNARIQSAGLTVFEIDDYNASVQSSITDSISSLALTPSDFNGDTTLSGSLSSANVYATGTFDSVNDTYFGAAPPTQVMANLVIAAYQELLTKLITVRTNAYSRLKTDLDLSGYQVGSLTYLKNANPVLYNYVKTQIESFKVTVNPSGAMAGVYARVDRERNVWKAPANVGVAMVTSPALHISVADQDGLNVDANGGKSINAIRAFTGRGILVWGARTLAGNDNEWRYVNVRRFFNYVEESVSKATAFVVFEPNNANTWQRVKGMIEAFLTGLWRDGALAGATTKEAYFVNVGLGVTMTADDVLNGKMIVEIGMAAVRPAEFIILRFEHKLQEQ
ncbi:MAG: phage tail sheath family protein [Bacteroidia bacterium]|nr:phage tail sheath family protein [Bacteroidia bacterium]